MLRKYFSWISCCPVFIFLFSYKNLTCCDLKMHLCSKTAVNQLMCVLCVRVWLLKVFEPQVTLTFFRMDVAGWIFTQAICPSFTKFCIRHLKHTSMCNHHECKKMSQINPSSCVSLVWSGVCIPVYVSSPSSAAKSLMKERSLFCNPMYHNF